MSIIGWIILGLIAGFIASKIVNKQGGGIVHLRRDRRRDSRGFLFSLVGAAGITGFNLWSMFVAIVGAVVVLLVYHAISGRSPPTSHLGGGLPGV
jgi:uncharacterized membrane protein YeaQ/YmgE (transglycosylase-associated protein family)